MRILVAGATGVLGRATLPHLKGRDVVGLTRSREKLPLLRALGAEGVL
jgi:nucleoside-diphosphate-sugar epimerase